MQRLLILTVLLSACSTRAQTVRRATLTPMPVPVRGNGQIAERTTLTIEGDSLTPTRAPSVGASQDVGLWSPRHQASADLALKLPNWENVTVRGIYTHIFREDAKDLVDVEIPDRDGMGFGTGVTITRRTENPAVVVGFSGELYLYRLPYVNGSGDHMSVTPGAAFGVVPSYHSGALTLFGGLTLRTAPSIEATGTVTGTDREGPSIGDLAAVLGAGAEYEIITGLKARLAGHVETIGSPVRYGPNVAAGVVIPLSGF